MDILAFLIMVISSMVSTLCYFKMATDDPVFHSLWMTGFAECAVLFVASLVQWLRGIYAVVKHSSVNSDDR